MIANGTLLSAIDVPVPREMSVHEPARTARYAISHRSKMII